MCVCGVCACGEGVCEVCVCVCGVCVVCLCGVCMCICVCVCVCVVCVRMVCVCVCTAGRLGLVCKLSSLLHSVVYVRSEILLTDCAVT